MDFSLDLVKLLIFILPAYVANATPVVLGGGPPIDLGFHWLDEKRIYGDGKTIRGFIGGFLSGFLVGAIESIFLGGIYLYVGLLLAFGAMFGDLLGSFLKRRMGVPRGQPMFILDQLSFIAVALLFALPIYPLSIVEIVILFILTGILHVVFNILANKMGLKRVPW